MRIAILTPLFPPDTGAPAPYVKLLVKKISQHQVTLVLYGHIPESVETHKTIILDKRWPKIYLIIKSLFSLFKVGKNSDLLLINNGPSSELPALIYSFFSSKPIKLCISDPLAKANQNSLYSLIHKLLVKRVHSTIILPTNENIYLPAEILPFTNESNESNENASDNWWENHIAEITNI